MKAYNIVAGNPDQLTPIPPQSEARPTQAVARAASSHLVNASLLLKHVAHPLRLEILLLLSDGVKSAQEIATKLGIHHHSNVTTQLAHLRDGVLVDSRKVGRPNFYSITDAGQGIVQVIHSTCSGLSIRKGGFSLLPEPITPGINTHTPTSSEGLACLFKSFATPLMLRVLNLLGSGQNVCVCHLSEVLAIPVNRVNSSLEYARGNRSIIEDSEGQLLQYRLSRAALSLYYSLMGYFGSRLSDAEVLQSDRERLGMLSPCTVPLGVMDLAPMDVDQITRRA